MAPPPGYTLVAQSIPRRAGARVHATLGPAERHVSVLRDSACKLHAIDSVCYHMGGPLTVGDIEDVAGRTCVICPWHKYKIVLETGEGIYQGINRTWESKGQKHRLHSVLEDKSGVYVRLEEASPATVESDGYAHKKFVPGAKYQN